MAASSNVTINVKLGGDITNGTDGEDFAVVENQTAPSAITLLSLASGANTITVPSSSGITVKGALLIPPAGNTQTLTLKGVSGDTGVALSKTEPTFISFDTPPATFVITAGGTIAGFRILWT